MLLIVLGILKVIGIVLLAVLGLLLLVVLLVLFVPFKYRAYANMPSDPEGEFPPKDTRINVRFSWLLHLINGGYTYNDEKGFYVRLAVFRLFPKREKEGKKDKRPENEPAEEQIYGTEAPLTQEAEAARAEDTEDQAVQETEAGTEEDNAYSGKKRKNNKNYTISSVCDKIEKVCSTLENPIFERALKCVKKEIARIARWIIPFRARGNILAGTGDPYSTAQVMAGYGIIYPLLKGRLSLEPDFERRVIEGELEVRGKLRLIVPVMSALRLLLNRDVRKTVKRFKYIAEA